MTERTPCFLPFPFDSVMFLLELRGLGYLELGIYWASNEFQETNSLKLLNLLDILEIHSQISRQKEFSNKEKAERLEIQLDYSLTG